MVKMYFQMLKGCIQWWDLPNPIFNVCPDNLQEWKKNQMKNECARVVTTLYSCILDAQVQLTL